ncbi:MAG: chitobiase/beta-hexosaminidase C-terminal domain-containing protein [Phycisphaerae bacterium]|nr:chitobiase/beta-hexosaminidase C-terminal domain-containing protein [Saprospiraceae bacterium]
MTQKRWTSVFSNLCFGLNCLLLFLALFGAKMELPAFLQVAGRMHPLVLHFPIVLLLLAGIWEMTIQTKNHPILQNISDGLLLSSAVSAVVTALMGLFLSKEGGYEINTLFWHQWSGIAVSVTAWVWYSFRAFFRGLKIATPAMAGLILFVLLIAGHQGATLTHGENYLFAPVTHELQSQPVSLENALVFEHLIRPILKEKCMNCHNSNKLKGDLNMETEALLLKGGKNGVLWDSTAKDLGLMLQRIHLPLEEKEHMPPKGKTQLTEEEISLLYRWIKNGANFSLKIVDLPENDTLRLLATAMIVGATTRVAPTPYPFEAADASIIQKLNNDYRVVTPLAVNSPALSVDFYGISAFKSAYLNELEVIKEQVVSLNLNKMPLNDDDLKSIAIFPNLRQLNLAFTQITGATLGELRALNSLRSLSLSGTSVKASDLEALHSLTELSVLYLWNTSVTEQDLPTLKLHFPKVHIELGFKGEGIIAKLNAPIIEDEAQVFNNSTKVKLKNFIRGAELRYTLDGTVPDSMNSPIYLGDSITIEKSCQLNAKAFLPGWISSEVATRSYYKSGILPDSIVLRYPPNPQYKGEGAKTLANKKIGDTEFRSNKWLGYKETNLEALLLFKKPTTLSSVSFSSLVDIGSYIMPAAEIQVWGGSNQRNLVLLKKLNPKQPEKVGAPGYRVGFNCTFKARKINVLKIVAKPVTKLPAWHPGKGERGWVFVDEVFLE